MDWMRVLFTRCTALFRKRKLDADLDEELRAHIEFAIEENRKRGMRERDARTKALQMFGGVTQTREAYRSQQGFPFFESLARDTQYAVRQLLKSPIFAVTAILTLALGIGATTAIFTMMNAVLLRSLPVPNPQQLVSIFTYRMGSPMERSIPAIARLRFRCRSSMQCARIDMRSPT